MDVQRERMQGGKAGGRRERTHTANSMRVGRQVVRDRSSVLVPMYTNAKTASGKLIKVVYCLMQVTKLVHATYVVTSLTGGSWAIRFSNDNSACFLCGKFWLLDGDHAFTVRR